LALGIQESLNATALRAVAHDSLVIRWTKLFVTMHTFPIVISLNVFLSKLEVS